MNQVDTPCDKKIFQKLFDEHAVNLQNFLFYKSGNAMFAEDSVQESFIRLWRNCAKVPLVKAKSYLFTIANNLFIDNARHQKIVLNFQNQPTKTTNKENPEFLLEVEEFRGRLIQAINQLPENQRTVFLMNRIDGMKYREIAIALDISQKAVEKRMHKALLEIRKITGKI